MSGLLDLVGGPKAIVGLLIPVLAIVVRKIASLYARHRILGFAADRIDVVLTSSAARNDPAVGFARSTTGKGSVQAFGTAVRAIGRFYRKTPITVHFSSQVDGKLDAELISIGGPRANRVTATVLKSPVVGNIPGLHFDDLNRCLTVAGLTIDDYDLAAVDGVPTCDIGVLIMCPSPFAIRRRRAVICCGFTSYGTFGTAEWFFGEVLTDSWGRPLAKQYGIPRWGMRLDRCYVAVLEFQIANGTVIGERVLLSQVFGAAPAKSGSS